MFIILKNPRDSKQIGVFASQFKPENRKFVINSYLEATKMPFSYLVIDTSQTCPNELRLRTNLFESDPEHNLVFVEND